MVFAMLSQQSYTKPCDCHFQSRIQTHRCTCTFAAFTIHINLLFTVHDIGSSMAQCFQSKGTCMFSYQHPTQWGAKVLVRWLAPLLRNRERSLPWHWGGCHQKDSPDVSNTSTASCFCLCWIRWYRRGASYDFLNFRNTFRIEILSKEVDDSSWSLKRAYSCKSSSNILSWIICDTSWVRCRTMTTVLRLQPVMLADSC